MLMFNLSSEEVIVEEGERCAQCVLERVVGSDVVDVSVDVTSAGKEGAVNGEKGTAFEWEGKSHEELVARLGQSERGSGGFGSTGRS